MDVKLATLIKSLNIMDVIFSGFTVYSLINKDKVKYVFKVRQSTIGY